MVVTSYDRNKNLDHKKNEKKANNSPSYRFGAIKKEYEYLKKASKTAESLTKITKPKKVNKN